MRPGQLCAILLMLCVVVVSGGGGCAPVIIPPATAAKDAVPVLIADYGYHSTLILPRSDGCGMIEYAYGDWTYFGQNQKSIGNALHALVASDQATMGRRMLDREVNQPGLKDALGAKTVLRFDAPRQKVEELERALEQRFSARLDSIVYSPVHQLYFVKDDEPYGMGHNCNHFTAQWLERLGCRVEGMVLTSSFKLKEPAPNPASSTTIETAAAQASSRSASQPASMPTGASRGLAATRPGSRRSSLMTRSQ
jgi:hypothetical protein